MLEVSHFGNLVTQREPRRVDSRVPDAGCTIGAGGYHVTIVGGEGPVPYAIVVPLEDHEQIAVRGVPDSSGVVLAGGDQETAVR